MLQEIEFSMGLKWPDTISQNILKKIKIKNSICWKADAIFYFLNLKIYFCARAYTLLYLASRKSFWS